MHSEVGISNFSVQRILVKHMCTMSNEFIKHMETILTDRNSVSERWPLSVILTVIKSRFFYLQNTNVLAYSPDKIALTGNIFKHSFTELNHFSIIKKTAKVFKYCIN
jgi:hypothetical protein